MSEKFHQEEKITANPIEKKIMNWVKSFGVNEKSFWKTFDDSVKDISASYFDMTTEDANSALDYLKNLTMIGLSFAGNTGRDIAKKTQELQKKLEARIIKNKKI